MSELKAFNCVDSDVQEFCEPRLVYLKSDADKVIAELKAQKAQAEDDCAYWKMREGNAANAMHETEEYAMQLYKELRHQKYKRCLMMYRYCSIKALYELDFKGNDVEWKWYSKWMHKWFKLAEMYLASASRI